MSNLPIAPSAGRIPVSIGSGVLYSADPATTPAVDFVVTDAINNDLTTVLTLDHETTGVPASGIGTRLALNTENSANASIVAGSIAARLTTVTATTPVGKFEIATVGHYSVLSAYAVRTVFSATYGVGGATYVFGVNDNVSGATPLNFAIAGASAFGGSGDAGAAGIIRGGTGDGASPGGSMTVTAGAPGGTARGADVNVTATSAGGGDNRGGFANSSAGDATGSGQGGHYTILTGNADTGNPGNLYVKVGTNAATALGNVIFQNGAGNSAPNVYPVVTNAGGLGTSSLRWAQIRAVSGFRRSLPFGLPSMNVAGAALDPLAYGSAISGATVVGYVMLRDGFITGISAATTAIPSHNVIAQVFIGNVAVGSFVVSISGGSASSARATPTPVAVVAGDIINIRYSSDAADSALGISATAEIED